MTTETSARFFWALALVSLPVTSFRYFPFVGEGTFVRPLAIYPIACLLIVFSVQVLGRKIPWPTTGALVPLTGLVLVMAATSVVGVLFAPIEMRGQTIFGRELRAWLTIIMGLTLFISSVFMNREEQHLRFTIKWLLAGLVLDLVWSGLQAVTFYTPFIQKATVTNWQLIFSMRELVRTNRISGLAYEPGWLAGQMTTLYLPWLFASLLTGIRVSRWRWFEPVLFIGAIILILASYSRGGLIQAVAAGCLTYLVAGRRKLLSGWKWFVTGFQNRSGLLSRLGIIFATAAIMVSTISYLGQKNYLSRLWNTNAVSLEEFVIENSAGARAAYILGSLAAYNAHPWTGVGLGASGFYIYSNLPDWTLTHVPEIARQLSPENQLYPNPKNLYIRLLAETGLIGFILFVAYLFAILGDALAALQKKAMIWQFLGAAGLFTWVALLLYNFTQDSFATPNLWINFGVLVGVSGGTLVAGNIRRSQA
jgi:O-antigen ligase